MTATDAIRSRLKSQPVIAIFAPLSLAVLSIAGGFLRLRGLGAPSLWIDELSTWHVSQLPLGESLRWPPEITIPPLYQLMVRLLDHGPHPPEWLLRLPAFVAGVAIIPAVYCLMRTAASNSTALAASALVTFQLALLQYSQEARPYTLLVLAAVLSTWFWFQLVRTSRTRYLLGYVLSAGAGLFAHLLVLPVLAAHLTWWVLSHEGRRQGTRHWAPATALALIAMLASPVFLRVILFGTTARAAVGWIQPPTVPKALALLGAVTYGWGWIALVSSSIGIWIFMRFRQLAPQLPGSGDRNEVSDARDDLVLLLLTWLAYSWIGLLAFSWIVQPLMVERYLLPAAISALLVPILIVERMHRFLAPAVALAAVLATAPAWTTFGTRVEPGFRELVEFVESEPGSTGEPVVLAVDHADVPGWDEAQRLPLTYYPFRDRPVHYLKLDAKQNPPPDSVLEDPRRFFLIVFRSDALELLAEAGRKWEPFEIEGREYQQLPFGTHRLIQVGPKDY
ncbi:MAG: glycosyltransferase family 39 protein [Phycisphaerae bacterium]|nr:glycosyltransferase family 39 protein [Phycisphaerae bacterium]